METSKEPLFALVTSDERFPQTVCISVLAEGFPVVFPDGENNVTLALQQPGPVSYASGAVGIEPARRLLFATPEQLGPFMVRIYRRAEDVILNLDHPHEIDPHRDL